MKSINPFTGETVSQTEDLTEEDSTKILSESESAFLKWRDTEAAQRSSMMRKAGEFLRNKADNFAAVITMEMGKTLKESREEILKCAWVCDYYADNAANFLADEKAESDASESFVRYEPLGTILGIMPWNFPFWQAFRFIVPTLMAGNTVVLKHASNVQGCAREIESVFVSAGFPEDVFRNLALGSSAIGRIIENDAVKAVSLTGSVEAGRKVAETAGRVLKKCVLELGGSNAFIVLADADLDKAVEIGVKSRFQNAGQSCIAAKRFIVDGSVADRFTEMFANAVRNLRAGDPFSPDTDMGPLSSESQADAVGDQLRRSVEKGASVVTGGNWDNALFSPTVVTGVAPGMPLFDEEVFGPVAPIIRASDQDEAITLAGDTQFGLGVTVFTRDIENARKMLNLFHDGAVFINGLVKSDPRLPFGGTRDSGYGRELSQFGIREFVNVKTIWISR